MLARVEEILGTLGGQLLQWREKGLTQGEWVGAQLKAEADRRAHDFLTDMLQQNWPGMSVISEEDPAHNANRPNEYWLIDPIDGTASFCGGYDGFVTQVALMRAGAPVLSAVHAPALGLTWTATDQEGPALNGRRIRAAAARSDRVLIDNYPEPRGIARGLFTDLHFTSYVESGSIGLKLCRVADGTADVFVKDVVVRDWDVAPAALIVERAGGQVRQLSGAAVAYDGSVEQAGVIGTASQPLMTEVLAWHDRHGASSRAVS